ncbi:MAG: hypothetical protein LBD21_03780 [Tannerellaceae bacterium]|jgi:hypothetical protein|nr:hypothetical protein [Tannerellaceae bacterium]
MMRVFKCGHCSKVHLEIGNTQIHFASLRDLRRYLKTLDGIDAAYYAEINKGRSKVIILPLDNAGCAHLGFSVPEFEMLKAVIRDYLPDAKQYAEPACKEGWKILSGGSLTAGIK